MKTLVVLPAYNEAKVLSETLEKLSGREDADVLVVDDGSSDLTSELADEAGVRVLRHVINMGLGAALTTGFEVAKREGYDVLATFDADGQHNPDDLSRLIGELKDADVVIGVRKLHRERMPYFKKVGNAFLNILTWVFFGVYSCDSQSGLRAFNRKAIDAINLKANRYEVSSEILYEAKANNLRVREVPVDVIYTSHSMQNGTGVLDGFRILWRMIIHERGR